MMQLWQKQATGFSKRLVLCSALAGAMAGCAREGLSVRESTGGYASRTPSYSNYVYSLYTDGSAAAEPERRPMVQLPIRVGIAQLGEVAPPLTMLEGLRKHPERVAVAQPMPGVFEMDTAEEPSLIGKVPAPSGESQARRHIDRMRRYARDLGLDYIFLFGGNVDSGSSSNGLSVLDLTVVGAFVVPSKELAATGRASGTLINVKTGRVVLAVTSDARNTRLASTVGEDGDHEKQLFALRDELVSKLTAELIQRLGNP